MEGCKGTVGEGGLQPSHRHEIGTFDLRLVRPTLQQSKERCLWTTQTQGELSTCTVPMHYSALQEQGESHIDMGPLSGSGLCGKVKKKAIRIRHLRVTFVALLKSMGRW